MKTLSRNTIEKSQISIQKYIFKQNNKTKWRIKVNKNVKNLKKE